MLSKRARLFALLVPRVRAGWPAIGAIALAVVLAHSGIAHLDADSELAAHYRDVIGGDGWSRIIGVLQLLTAGGLCFRRTRTMTAAAFAAVVLIGIGNQLRTDTAGLTTLTSIVLVAWACAVAWGESRRPS
jgi:hypothetical protein